MSSATGCAPTLRLPAILNLQAATPLAEALLARRGEDLQVDGSDVQRLGAQCLQVLLAAQSAWTADARTLRIVNPSADLVSTMALMGVDPASAILHQEQTS